MSTRLDRHALTVIASAYRVADDVETWLAGVLEAATPLLDRGAGIHGYTYLVESVGADFRARPTSRVVATPGTPPGFADTAARAVAEIPSPLIPGLYCRGSAIAVMSDLVARLGYAQHPEFRPFDSMRTFGVDDMVGVVTCEPEGSGLLLCAPTMGHDEVNQQRVRRWTAIRAHLLAGLRLQRACGRPRDEAVVDPSGRVVHAEGAARSEHAREALRTRARAIDTALGTAGRRDPQSAILSWNALVRGEWSLIDHFDRDGRRYFVARRNEPRVGGARTLSRREQHVLAYASLGYSNKEIAYTLGLSPSTVSSHLNHALRRIGATSAASLAPLSPPVDREGGPESTP